ncbi:MAG: NADH-quinone oxidoreductase subunit N [Deltaproteobacteria bacterium]|nr:NADH-quinone oxidoreductase subunit N [Deltaproteobacteria bacterium]MBW2070930.1 NADH-quinone oxidoreductase subunit N [Deltaproteobacteria bacterium]
MIPATFIQSNLQGLSFFGPELILTLAILILLVLGIVLPFWRYRLLYTLVGITALAASLLPLFWLHPPAAGLPYLSELFVWDWLTFFFRPFFVVAAAFTILLSQASLEIEKETYSECVLLVLAVTAGMMLLVAATDLLMIYLAFETMGILSYVLVGIRAKDSRSGEAALKYVLYGAFTSGTMLFGFSLVFGLVGSTSLAQISSHMAAAAQNSADHLLLVLVLLFFLAGLLFKTAAFPFHFWCPDVYEGAPTPITAFLSVGPKAAGFALFLRFFYPMFTSDQGHGLYKALAGLQWPAVLALISAITMTLGNLAALRQNNLKRLLAYSSIAHAGYLFMGIVCLTGQGLRSVVFYLVVYLFMNLGAFAVVTVVAGAGGSEEINSYRGLASKAPFTCVAMAIFLFSLVGLPPFAGFIGKVYLFAAVISEQIYWLAVVAAVNTVISLYYYLRIVKAMFLETSPGGIQISVPLSFRLLLASLLIPTLGLGLYWQPLATVIASMF